MRVNEKRRGTDERESSEGRGMLWAMAEGRVRGTEGKGRTNQREILGEGSGLEGRGGNKEGKRSAEWRGIRREIEMVHEGKQVRGKQREREESSEREYGEGGRNGREGRKEEREGEKETQSGGECDGERNGLKRGRKGEEGYEGEHKKGKGNAERMGI